MRGWGAGRPPVEVVSSPAVRAAHLGDPESFVGVATAWKPVKGGASCSVASSGPQWRGPLPLPEAAFSRMIG